MSTERIDGATLVSIIDAKIAALQKLREATIDAIDAGALSSSDADLTLVAPGSRESGAPTELPEGAFRNKSIPACIELYLSTVGMKKKTNKEITESLTEGGVETTADSLENSVASALFKLKKAGRVLRFKDGWGLASNYPAHIRGAAVEVPAKKPQTPKKARPSNNAGPSAKPQISGAKTKKKRHTASKALQAATMTVPAAGRSSQESPQARIVSLLRSRPQAEFSGEDVARELPDIKRNTIGLILGRLTDERRKVAERTASGKYRIAVSGNQMQVVN